MLWRIDVEHATAQNGNGTAAGRQSAAVSRRIDAAGQSAHDGVAGMGEAAAKLFSHSETIGRGMPRTDDCDGHCVAWLEFTAHKKHARWVGNVRQKARVALACF